MAKKSRRLPGGKVRKPLAQHPRPTTSAASSPPAVLVEDEEGEETLAAPVAPAAAKGASVTSAPTRPAPAAAVRVAEPRRVGVGARRAPGATSTVPRRSANLMDLAAANYGHIRTDLARIGILAAIMLSIIVALSFVLK